MGRALYRESGPSQDGDPDTGNLLFFFFLYFIFFSNFFFFFYDLLIFYQAFKQPEVFFVYSSFHVITLGKVYCHFGKFILFLHSLTEDMHRNTAEF